VDRKEIISKLEDMWACNEGLELVKLEFRKKTTPSDLWRKIVRKEQRFAIWLLEEKHLLPYGSKKITGVPVIGKGDGTCSCGNPYCTIDSMNGQKFHPEKFVKKFPWSRVARELARP
jgi:hypothetical protein